MAIQLKNWIRFVEIMTKRETMNDSEIATDLELKDAGAVQSWISRLKGRARKEAGIDDLISEWTTNPDKFRVFAGMKVEEPTPTPTPTKEDTPVPAKEDTPKPLPRRSKKLEEVTFELHDIIMHVVDLKKKQDAILDELDLDDEIDSLDPTVKSFLHATIGKGKKRVRMAEDSIKFFHSYLKTNNLIIVKNN